MSEEKEICFVIMPISKTTKHTQSYWAKHFKTFLKPLIEENPSLEARRSKPLRGGVLSEIITALVTSPVVVADLTDQNPNVFWEFGVRQSFKQGTVTIAEEGTKLPFDVGGKGTLFYSNDRLENEGFRSDFKEAIVDCLSNPERPDSQVLETLSGRGTLFEIFRRNEAIRRLDAVLSEIEENSKVEKRLNDIIHANIERKKKKERSQYLTSRFMMTGVELLWTDRYVDEDQSFFESTGHYLHHAMAINQTLNTWSLGKNIDQWWQKEEKNWNAVVRTFKPKVVAARDKLSKRF